MNNYVSEREAFLYRVKDSDISSGACKSSYANKNNFSGRSCIQEVNDSIHEMCGLIRQ